MKVTLLKNPSSGNPVANQYELRGIELFEDFDGLYTARDVRIFQSYNSTVAVAVWSVGSPRVLIDRGTAFKTRTTTKYLSVFLKVSTQDIKARLDSGQYTYADLNDGE
jgi:hypothetical protein